MNHDNAMVRSRIQDAVSVTTIALAVIWKNHSNVAIAFNITILAG